MTLIKRVFRSFCVNKSFHGNKNTPVSNYLLAGGLLNLACVFQVLAHGDHKHTSRNDMQSAEFVVLQITKQGPQIRRIDINGNSQSLFNVAKGDKLYQMEHAPDKPEMLLSYQKTETGEQGIWRLSYNLENEQNTNAKLHPVLVDDDPKTFYFDPLYDGSGTNEGIYFISAMLNEKTRRASKELKLNHLNLQNQQQKLIANNATYPSLSEQGQYLTWIERSESSRELKVLNHKSNKSQSFTLPDAKTQVRFSRISEHHNSLFFFTNKEKLFTGLPRIFEVFFPKAMAHAGHKHADYFGWQLSLDKADMVESQHNWQVQDIRGFDISPDGESVAWITGDGLQVRDIISQKALVSIRNPNYWKLIYIN